MKQAVYEKPILQCMVIIMNIIVKLSLYQYEDNVGI